MSCKGSRIKAEWPGYWLRRRKWYQSKAHEAAEQVRTVQLGNHNYPAFQRGKNWDKRRDDPEFQSIMREVEGYWEQYQEQFGRS